MRILEVVHPYRRILFFLGLFIAFFLYSMTYIDLDFGWHLQSGNYFLSQGIPVTDVFTYTASQFPWVNHEWLSDMVVAWLFSIGGYPLLALVFAGLWTASIALVSKKVPLGLVFVAAIALMPFLGVRALTWTVFFVAILITIFTAKNQRWRLAIPPLMLLWASMHGSFLIGFAYGAWILIKQWSWKLFALGVLAFALTFCTPYGYHLYVEIFRTVLDANLSGIVGEWARFALPITSVVYVLVWCGLLVAVNGKKWRQYLRFDSLLLIWSVVSVRMLPIFIIVSLSQLPQVLKKLSGAIPTEAKARSRKATRIGLWVLAGVALSIQVATMIINHDNGVVYPRRAVAYLQQNPCNGNLFNSYNFGGYLIWNLPSHKVYIDGRMPSWQHEGHYYLETYREVLKNPEVRNSEFAKYSIGCVLIENVSPLADDLRQEGWETKINDGYSTLFIK